MQLRDTPGLPDPNLAPPVVAEGGDPFAELRITHLLARLPRGAPVPIREVAAQLGRDHLDWSFPRPVIVAAIVQLQANWRVDYRSHDGILLEDGPDGPAVTIEESARVDPWILRQVERRLAACHEALRRFAIDEDGGARSDR